VAARRIIVALAALTLASCDVSMTQQRKYTTYKPSQFWDDGSSARPLPQGVVAQNYAAREVAAKNPPPITLQLLKRGQERFKIFCSPCHGLSGDGDGVVAQRGFPHPPSYFSANLIAAPAQHFYDVITEGYGVMYSYAARVEPADRWAIVAYIRALQLSRSPAIAKRETPP
jgi:mono/diheme cytochrome c family protein